MEFIMEARALKSSLRQELSVKSTHQVCFDDFWCFAGNNGVSGDDFSVDDLFDFSNQEFEEKDSISVPSCHEPAGDDDSNSNFSNFSTAGDSDSLFSGDLAVPVDDVAGLEWVSQFVDDSLSDFPQYDVVSCITLSHSNPRSEPVLRPVEKPRPPFSSSQVPSKARTKRPRPAGQTWHSPHSDSSSSSSLSSSISCLSVTDPATKRQKILLPVHTGGLSGSVQFQRRCSHCQVEKTPQWRTGPLGAKTLCNACGVRFKSGRLYPEYRPACSPTFSNNVHSNSHRKVLEMRKKKDLGGPEFGVTQMVSSF